MSNSPTSPPRTLSAVAVSVPVSKFQSRSICPDCSKRASRVARGRTMDRALPVSTYLSSADPITPSRPRAGEHEEQKPKYARGAPCTCYRCYTRYRAIHPTCYGTVRYYHCSPDRTLASHTSTVHTQPAARSARTHVLPLNSPIQPQAPVRG